MVERSIVIVSDRVASHSDYHQSRADLEYMDDIYYNDFISILLSLNYRYIHYDSPDSFIRNIDIHRNDIVFPLWSGQGSRNRRALLPSICEAAGITYVGGDAFTNIVCQDKEIAKSLARRSGFLTPEHITVESEEDLEFFQNLEPPLVVKPSREGGSIGITHHSLVNNIPSAVDLSISLLKDFQQPILVEQFISGSEVTICMVGNYANIHICTAMEVFLADNPDMLTHGIFSNEIKKNRNIRKCYRPIGDSLQLEVFQSARHLFHYLQKCEMLRIDGRHNIDGFFVIEVSPDVNLGRGNDFDMAARFARTTYEELIERIIKCAVNQKWVPQEFQNANR